METLHQDWPLVLGISWQLFCSIGLVFFLLSTTSIFFQSWLSEADLPERRDPYQLFAASNLGSFAGLLTYPVFFEYFFTLPEQQFIWRSLYLVLLGLMFAAARLIRLSAKDKGEPLPNPAASRDVRGWFLLGAAGVMMLLSVTNILTSEILPIPLLWTFPLAIYLLSFYLTFKKNPWGPGWVVRKPFFLIIINILLYFAHTLNVLPVLFELAAFSLLLFYLCMFIQMKLYASKPESSRQLSYYYFIFSLGGFCGGMFITWFVPLLSISFVEYLTGLYVCVLAWQITDARPVMNIRRGSVAAVAVLLLMVVFPQGGWLEWLVIVLLLQTLFVDSVQPRQGAKIFTLSLVCVFVFIGPLAGERFVFRGRNYYGLSRIYDKPEGLRYFLHGSTIHGVRYLDERSQTPLAYYAPDSPIGGVLQSSLFHFHDIASLGLGVGSIMSYFREGQKVDSYELDPEIIRLAEQYFTFLTHSPADIHHWVGDARMALRNHGSKSYDLIIVDTFSGDSVPVHLITLEALQEYKGHLQDKGLILFHLSNRFADVRRMLCAEALSLGARVAYLNGQGNGVSTYASKWVAVTWDEVPFRKLTEGLGWKALDRNDVRPVRLWTDDYSTFLPILLMTPKLTERKRM